MTIIIQELKASEQGLGSEPGRGDLVVLCNTDFTGLIYSTSH